MKRAMMMAAALMLMGQAPPAARVSDLGWMSGHWETSEGGRWTEETWSAPRAGTMIGFSRSGRGETLGEFEFIQLRAGADGVPTYIASPGGGPPVSFPLVASTASSVTFENPGHDYPQRIHYRRDGDVMVATISARDGSNAMSWTYHR